MIDAVGMTVENIAAIAEKTAVQCQLGIQFPGNRCAGSHRVDVGAQFDPFILQERILGRHHGTNDIRIRHGLFHRAADYAAAALVSAKPRTFSPLGSQQHTLSSLNT